MVAVEALSTLRKEVRALSEDMILMSASIVCK
jgi:hypothetical protein